MVEGNEGIEKTSDLGARPRHVLVVEDDDGLRNLILKSLRKAAYEADGVGTGTDALACVMANPGLALLLDQKLPDMSGSDVISILNEKGHRVPFVVMTGQGDERLAVEMMKLGAADYLVKTLDLVDLLPGVFQRLFRELDNERRLRATEARLRESEAKCRGYLENAPDGVFIVDEKGRYVEVNKAACLMTGYAEEELLQMSIPDLLLEESLESGLENFRKLIETGMSEGESQFRHKDGSKRWWFADTVKLSQTRYLGFSKDITKRKQADMLIRDSEEKFSKAFEKAPLLITISSIENGTYLDVNEKFTDVSGFKREDAIGKTSVELGWLKEKDREILIQELKKKGSIGGIELELEAKDKRKIFCLYHGEVINIGGRQQLLSIAQDVTERKRAEENLRKIEVRLAEAQRVANIGSWELEVKTLDLWWSDETFRIFGFVPGDFSPTLALFFKSVHPDDRALTESMAEVAWNERKSFDLDHKIILPSGETRIVHEHAEFTCDNSGQPVRMVGTVQDITGRKRVMEEKRSLEERLMRAEKMEALGTLAGGVAHDLNNVLGIVVGYAEMLKDEIDPSSTLREDVMKIMEGGTRAAAIVQDLLTLARRGVHTRKVVNLNAIVSDFQRTPEFEKVFSYNHRVSLETDLEADLLNIMGSPVHLSKTIINLVSNAVESMPDGGTLTIKTSSQYLDKSIHGYDNVREGDYVVLAVSDMGEGIPERDIKRIFEPFYTKKIMGRSGTGLGLAVVWGTVKDHNGYINVESEEGKGSTFTIYFPVTREDIDADMISVSISEYMGKGETILVVDDVKGQRDLASRMLSKLDYKMATVASGEEAVDYLKTNEADLIVLDMIMDPGIDGLETYKQILEISPNQKAIIVSGFSESEQVKQAQKLGAGPYIKKPYVLERLGLAVKNELNRNQ